MVIAKDPERMTKFFDGAVDNFEVERVKAGVMQFQHTGQDFFHECRWNVVIRAFQQGADLAEDLLVRRYRTGATRRHFHRAVIRAGGNAVTPYLREKFYQLNAVWSKCLRETG